MNPKQRLDRACLALCRQIVFIRADNKCQCGCGRAAQDPSHIINRDRKNTRYFLDNQVALSRVCHDHARPKELKARHIKIIGQAKYDFLEALSKEYKCWRENDLKILKSDLTEILKNSKEVK